MDSNFNSFRLERELKIFENFKATSFYKSYFQNVIKLKYSKLLN